MTLHPDHILHEELYNRALIQPAAEAHHLSIVSGYASPAMLGRLIYELEDLKVDLVVGMVGHEGVLLSDHEAFLKLQKENPHRVNISYTTLGRSVHTKLYVWRKGPIAPVQAFAGSSNFSQNGFLVGRRKNVHSEILAQVHPVHALMEYERVQAEAVSILDPQLGQKVRMKLRTRQVTEYAQQPLDLTAEPDLTDADSVILPLVSSANVVKTGTKKGHPHGAWGLNWGQREGRAGRNEAVIPIPKRIWTMKPDFFPAGESGNRPTFTVVTDDHHAMLMVVAEAGDKALHSLPSNSDVGRWFRKKLGVAEDAKVSMDDLKRFGSRFVKMHRLDDETYFLEYNASLEAEGIALYGYDPM